MAASALAGRRILLVEDNFHIAMVMAELLRTEGAEIIGPKGTVADALAIIAVTEHLDGAALDINLQGELVYPVVDALRAKGVPVVFITGYDEISIKPGYADVPCLQKPIMVENLTQALLG